MKKKLSSKKSSIPIQNSLGRSSILALELALTKMRENGLRRTPGRERILRFLIDNHGPFSKDEIQKALSSSDLDSVTLYRNLSQFEKIDLIRRSEFRDGVSRYEFQLSAKDHHHHVVCIECRKVDSLNHCEIPKLESYAKRLGYSEVKHALEFFGICGDCSDKKSA